MKRHPESAPPEEQVRRGRPRNPEPASSVCTWLASSDHDKLIELANKHETSVSALVRSLLKMRIRRP